MTISIQLQKASKSKRSKELSHLSTTSIVKGGFDFLRTETRKQDKVNYLWFVQGNFSPTHNGLCQVGN